MEYIYGIYGSAPPLSLKGVKEVLKRSNSSHREETCYVEALFYF